jgi:hypothetical protein
VNGITPSPAPRRPRRWLRRLVFAFTVLAVVLVAGALFYLPDEPPPNDDDLQLHSLRVPDSENGLVQIQRLPLKQLSFDYNFGGDSFAAAHGLTDDNTITQIEQGLARNDTVVDAFLAQAQPAFTQLDAILALPHFENAGEAFSNHIWLDETPLWAVTQSLRLEVIRSLQKADYATATNDTLRLFLLASRLAAGDSSGLSTSAPWSYSNAIVCARDLLNKPALPASEQNSLAQALAANEPSLSSFQRNLVFDYQLDLSFLQHDITSFEYLLRRGLLQAGNPPPTTRVRLLTCWLHFTLQPNTTQRLLADYYRGLSQALNGPYSRIDFPALQALRPGFGMPQTYSDPRFSWLVASNAGGRYLLNGLLLASSNELLRIPYQEIAASRLLRLGFALRGCFNDHGVLPPTLAALVPQYLSTIPTDPFDDQPFHYDPTRSLVYSVGTALQDTHGSRYLTAPSPNPDYPIDPLLDAAQPTLLLTFQNKTSPPAPPLTALPPSPSTPAQPMSN